MPTMPENPPTTAHIEDLLPAYHAGALAPAEAERVQLHLSACAACQRASQAVALDQLIRSAPAPTVGLELRQRVYARIVAASEQEQRQDERLDGRSDAGLRAQRGAWAAQSSVGAPHRAPSGLWAGAAALVVVALLASVFWALPRMRQTTTPLGGDSHHAGVLATVSPVPAACPASATSATIPANAIIADMTLTSPTEGWAVGSIMTSQGYAGQGLVLRLHQCHWAPVALSLPNIGLTDLSMDSATDGWAIGNHTDSEAPYLLHYSNGAWSGQTLPALPNNVVIAQSYFAQVRALAGEVWLTAFTPKNSQGQTGPMLLLHLVNGQWASVASPLPILYTVAPVGPGDLWVLGQTSTTSDSADTYRFAHLHNGQWTVMKQPAGATLLTLHANSPSDIWASGYIPTDPHGTTTLPVVAHYDGTGWQVAPQALSPYTGSATGIESDTLGDGVGWATRTSEVVASGSQSGPPSASVTNVWLETGGQWQALPWPYKDINSVNSMTPVSSGEAWAIAGHNVEVSTPLPSGGTSGFGYTESVLLHYADGAWTRYG